MRIGVRRARHRARTLTLADRPAGLNRVRLGVRARGRYRLTLTATDAAGNRAAPLRARFRIATRRSSG